MRVIWIAVGGAFDIKWMEPVQRWHIIVQFPLARVLIRNFATVTFAYFTLKSNYIAYIPRAMVSFWYFSSQTRH